MQHKIERLVREWQRELYQWRELIGSQAEKWLLADYLKKAGSCRFNHPNRLIFRDMGRAVCLLVPFLR